MKKMLYRTLDDGDVSQFRALILEGTRDFPRGFLNTYEEAQSINWSERLNSGNYRGVFNEDKLIGICVLRRSARGREKHRTELGPFFVTEQMHGKGVAQFMMQSVIEETRRLGAEVIELFVDEKNERAIKFYEKSGFEARGALRDSVRIDGEPCVDLMYHRWV